MKNCLVAFTICCAVLVPGCSKPEAPVELQTMSGRDNPVPPKAAFNAAISVSGLPESYECKVLGEIHQDKTSILKWETPGTVAFDIVIPCEEPVDLENVWTTVLFHDKGGDPVSCSSARPTAKQQDGFLYLTMEHTVLGTFDTNDQCVIKVDEFREAIRHEIGRVELPINFVQKK